MSKESTRSPEADDPRFAAVILAAGRGTRMRSDLPKVLHSIGNLPMVGHVMRMVAALGADKTIIIVGHEAEQVRGAIRGLDAQAQTALQEPQLGTGHAVQQAVPMLGDDLDDVVVLFGDTPLIRPETIANMRQARRDGAGVVVLGFEPETPGRYGRLVTDVQTGALTQIVEAKDASEEQLAIRLCNGGVMCLDGRRLAGWLSQLSADNAAGEYYLTDLVAIAGAQGVPSAVVVCDEDEVQGVNNRAELSHAEETFQERARVAAMLGGATLQAPDTVYFSADTVLGRDVIVEPNVVFGPGVVVGDKVTIRAFSHLEGCALASHTQVGPYARLRPGAALEEGARVGNFVEIKNAAIGAGAKVNHLSYIGDAQVGARSNIGAGTITCNYDGYLKHQTQIGEDVFVGSNTSLIAPVTIGDRANIAAGSAISQDVAADALAFGRARQSQLPQRAADLRKALEKAKRDRKS
ncbi:MAG: bifunctional UDP-N-acetylglucosamine diphosphorylase/glucosamine-1-phosphate N-acetyltransferase GlmU [Neomegalonema sp.]|nr:bifunctional UDP-N-acetylglucosamine diphosphorylase/glucosamine-1-phosphate N-acetyltransferase GlmU [Neomegalonema sp.]